MPRVFRLVQPQNENKGKQSVSLDLKIRGLPYASCGVQVQRLINGVVNKCVTSFTKDANAIITSKLLPNFSCLRFLSVSFGKRLRIVWRPTVLPVKRLLCHSSIYGHIVRVCCKYAYCACCVTVTPHATTQHVLCGQTITIA